MVNYSIHANYMHDYAFFMHKCSSHCMNSLKILDLNTLFKQLEKLTCTGEILAMHGRAYFLNGCISNVDFSCVEINQWCVRVL